MAKRNKNKNKLPYSKEKNLVENFSPKTEKQEELVNLINNKEVTIVKGPSGSGKTYTTLATALNLLGDKYKQIILVKSLTTVPEEDLGFLKGSLQEKMDPYIMSYAWTIDKLCGYGASKDLMDKKLISVLPIAFARGISIDNSIVIVDEIQNLSKHTFKTLITRIGDDSKYIFMGDVEQIDRRNKSDSPLELVYNIFKDSNIVGTVEFTDDDCVRNPIIPEILSTLRENNI